MKLRCGWVMACLLPVASAWGADETGRLNVLSMGTKTCNQVVEEAGRGGINPLMNSVWVGGYLTALNSEVYAGFDVAAGTDLEMRDRWILDYCARNPAVTLYHATDALSTYLRRRPQ